jgi:hypothetical protein
LKWKEEEACQKIIGFHYLALILCPCFVVSLFSVCFINVWVDHHSPSAFDLDVLSSLRQAYDYWQDQLGSY